MYEGNFKNSIFFCKFLLQSDCCIADGSTKIIRSIGSFKVLLECLDFFDMSQNTIFNLILHRSKSFGKMMMKCRNIKKLCFIVITPPQVEFVSVEKVRFEGGWTKFRMTNISGYLPVAGSLGVDCVVKNERILSYIKWFWEDLNEAKLSCDKVWLVRYQGNMTFRLIEPQGEYPGSEECFLDNNWFSFFIFRGRGKFPCKPSHTTCSRGKEGHGWSKVVISEALWRFRPLSLGVNIVKRVPSTLIFHYYSTRINGVVSWKTCFETSIQP